MIILRMLMLMVMILMMYTVHVHDASGVTLVLPYFLKASDAGDISPPFFWIFRQILG